MTKENRKELLREIIKQTIERHKWEEAPVSEYHELDVSILKKEVGK